MHVLNTSLILSSLLIIIEFKMGNEMNLGGGPGRSRQTEQEREQEAERRREERMSL